ncbi:condensation domain-containing protein [Okeania sp. SIO3B5]|uniref:condensation domain-containing protein n=1 Tax=Okeania sp. SIO3B5 TaxID=2607811 RepID=UPI0025D93358|nr:condensation domain-containing protein [Okeania sp. SIO3B5]
MDLSRTVGWFTMVYPLKLELTQGGDYGATLKSIKEQIRQIPDRGIGYGILRYLGDEITRRRLTKAENSEILFNYLGQSDCITGKEKIEIIQDISVGQLRDLRNSRSYLLEINA